MCYGGCDCQRCNPPDEPTVKTQMIPNSNWYARARKLYRDICGRRFYVSDPLDEQEVSIDRLSEALTEAEQVGLERAVGIIRQCEREFDESQWQSKLVCLRLIEVIRKA